jgi:hypothetical protein
VLPVPETVCVAFRVATDHCDEGEGEDDQNEDDLGRKRSVCCPGLEGMIVKLTLPPLSQNSASPKTLMARTLRILDSPVRKWTHRCWSRYWYVQSEIASSRNVLLRCLPVKNLEAMLVVVVAAYKKIFFKLTIQARGIAHGGMSSLQKFRTVDKAVISNGIRRAS